MEINKLQNNQWAKKELISEIRKYFDIDENEDTTCQNLRDATKQYLEEKPYIKNKGKSQISYLTFHLKTLESKSEISRMKEITQVGMEINQIREFFIRKKYFWCKKTYCIFTVIRIISCISRSKKLFNKYLEIEKNSIFNFIYINKCAFCRQSHK